MLEALLVSTAVVAIGELGDKTQLLSLVLAARFRRVSESPGWSRDSYFNGAQSGGALLDLQPQHPLAAARLVLLQQLDHQRLNLAADWLGAAAGEPDRLAVQQRLERFSRLLDRLQAAAD